MLHIPVAQAEQVKRAQAIGSNELNEKGISFRCVRYTIAFAINHNH